MRKTVRRREILQTGFALCASLIVPAARACEFFAPNLRVYHPWTRATTADATAAAVCMKIDEVTKADRLIGAITPVASGAQIVTRGAASRVDLVIPEGGEVLLEEEGTYLRLVGLVQPLLIGRSYPLKLVFDKGGVVDTQLNVDYFRTLSAPDRSPA